MLFRETVAQDKIHGRNWFLINQTQENYQTQSLTSSYIISPSSLTKQSAVRLPCVSWAEEQLVTGRHGMPSARQTVTQKFVQWAGRKQVNTLQLLQIHKAVTLLLLMNSWSQGFQSSSAEGTSLLILCEFVPDVQKAL